jgi:hypothetical protein
MVWLWPANLSEEQILAAANEIRAAGVATVFDPAEEPWTHILNWDGANWRLQQAGATSSINLGTQLTANVLKQHLAAGAQLWPNFPPPRELAAKLVTEDLERQHGAADYGDADHFLQRDRHEFGAVSERRE